MGYIEQNLVADERIIFKGEIHWMRYARPILIIFLGVLALYWNLWAVIALTKVEGVHIEQSFLGRLLNYGTVVVTTGEVINRFEYLAYPAQFSNSVHEVVQSLDTEDPTRLSQLQTNSKSAKLPHKGCLIILIIIALAIVIAKNILVYQYIDQPRQEQNDSIQNNSIEGLEEFTDNN